LSSENPHISTPDAILRIKKLIEKKLGDPGRLQYISETLLKGRDLYRSDQIYLDNKISATVIPFQIKKPAESDEMIKGVKRLLALNFGDPGRLRFILHTLEKGKDLYNTDEIYFDSKIEQLHEFTEGKKLKRIVRSRIPKETSELDEEVSPQPVSEKIVEEQAKEPYQPPIPESIEEPSDGKDTEAKQTSDLFDLIEDTSQIDLEIKQEREKLSKLKHSQEQIKIQRDELSQLIVYRQEYEQKINREKEILEKEIKIEQQNVKDKDKLVEELIKNQTKLIQSKTEREVLVEQIKIDKEKSEADLQEKQNELEELKKEYEELQKKIKLKKQILDDKIKKEKEKIDKLKEDSDEN